MQMVLICKSVPVEMFNNDMASDFSLIVDEQLIIYDASTRIVRIYHTTQLIVGPFDVLVER